MQCRRGGLVVVLACCWAGVCFGAPILIDHRDTDITQLTESRINRAKSKLHIAYSHTSHGSQLTEGMSGLVDFANGGGRGLRLPRNIFAWNHGGRGGALDLHDYAMDGDVGYYPDWFRNTIVYLADPAHARVNVVVWSWCGQMTEKYREGTLAREYLRPMAELERRYPHVVFVYMTGHVDIWDDADNKAACRMIRNWCAAGNRVLYDFNDIEHYNPDGVYYPYVGDDCGIYDGPAGNETGNWATQWQNTHTEGVDWYDCESAHSQPLNANLKADAAWALWCKIADTMSTRVDLAIRNLRVTRPGNIALRRFNVCKFHIVNRGAEIRSATVGVHFHLSRDRTFGNADDRKIGDTKFRGLSIAAGATKTITMGWRRRRSMVRLWSADLAPRGYYYLFARISPISVREARWSDNVTRTRSRFPYSNLARSLARSAKAAGTGAVVSGPTAWARSGAGAWAAAPELVDGDTATTWAGEPGAGTWAVALDFGDIIPLADLELQLADDYLIDIDLLGTEDLLEWFDLDAITKWPVACRALFFDFRDAASGEPPAIREIRWKEE